MDKRLLEVLNRLLLKDNRLLDEWLSDIGLSEDLRLDDLDLRLDDLLDNLLLRLVDNLFSDWDVFNVLDLSLLSDVLSSISGFWDVLSINSLDWDLFDIRFLLWDILSDGGVVHLRNVFNLMLNGVIVSNLSGDWDLLNFLYSFVVSVDFLDWDL